MSYPVEATGDEYSFMFTVGPEGVPVELWSAMWKALEKSLRKQGYRSYCKASTGLARIYVRRLSS